MLAFRLLTLLVIAQTVEAEDHQCAPNESKGNRLIHGKGFTVDQHCKLEHQARANVLEEAQCR